MPTSKPKISAQLALFAALFLISGAAGLIYEIIWERLLELYFGVTMTSITLIVSSYMAGLGLGSLFGGRLTQKLKTPLFIYGFLEIGIGLFGLISPILLNWIGRSTAGSPYWLVFILSFAFLLAPTFLMGMTLPLLSQAFITRVDTSGQVIGLLYGINTLGAAFGCLLAGYVLIGKFGFDGASIVAVAFNVGVGMIAILASRWISFPTPSPSTQTTTKNTTTYWTYRQILFTSFIVGFIGLGFEMLWIRILHIFNKNTSYGFASILFVFLIGLAIGGYYWGRRADTAPDPEKLFWLVEIGVSIIASLVFLYLWISLNTNISFPGLSDFSFMQKPAPPFVAVNDIFVFSPRQMLFSLFNYFLPILVIVLPASFMMGGGLPILDRIAINSPEVAGRKVGDIHLANIIGSVFGSLVISFWMLPTLGTEWTHKALVLLGLTFPVFYFIRKADRFFRDPASVTVIMTTVALLFFLPSKGQLYPRLFETMTGDQAIAFESSDSVVTLTFDSASRPKFLWIGGETNSFYPPDGTYESRGILCAGASQPKRVLIIGMGGGVAARFFQTIPDIQEIVIVELMTDLSDLLYNNVELTRPVFDDPRVRYITDDGRRYLYAHPNDKIDIIFADPLRWYSSGHNNLYSLEAMQLYQAHLAEHGVFCAYVDQAYALPFTIAQVFPDVDQYAFRAVIASNQQIQYNLTYMESIEQKYVTNMSNFLKPGTEKKLSPKYLLSEFLRDRRQIISDEKKSPILSDLKPELEYYFFDPPIRRAIWLKGNFRTILLPRIQACNQLCQQEILDLTSQKP